MKIPVGVTSLLGSGEVSADGKASDIVRVFGDDLYIDVDIRNADFGLLEKADVNIAEVEIEESGDILHDGKYLVILDRDDEVVGYIRGVDEF